MTDNLENKENMDNLKEGDIVEDLLKRLIFLRDSGVEYLPISSEVMNQVASTPIRAKLKVTEDVDEKNCTRCDFSKTRTNVVLGSGVGNVKLMILGSSPTKDDDIAGKPFQGKEGELLSKIVKAMGIDKEDIFFSYGVRCYSEGEVTDEHISECSVHLVNDFLKAKPKVVLAFGDVAGRASNLLNAKESYVVPGLSEMVADESLKLETWDTIKKIMQVL